MSFTLGKDKQHFCYYCGIQIVNYTGQYICQNCLQSSDQYLKNSKKEKGTKTMHGKNDNQFNFNTKPMKPICHHSGLVTCFRVKRNTIGKYVTISGAQKSEISQSLLNHRTLFLNCSDYEFRKEFLHFSNKKLANRFSSFLRSLDVIDISWRDGSAPPLPAKFWRELLALAKTKYDNLVCFCVGGHGRTGTALSSLYMVANRVNAIDAVDYVRKNHCDESVETFVQAQYLADLQRALKIEIDNVETGRNILGEIDLTSQFETTKKL